METRAIFDEFFETKPHLLDDILSLERKRGVRVLSPMAKEINPIHFFARLSEIRFGLFFDPISDQLKYNSPIRNKRPDWLINMKGQLIMAEVLRLNTPEEECRNDIERNRELRQFQKANPGLPIIEYGNAKIISAEYLCGAQSKLVLKEEKYRSIIEQEQLPFIVCIAPNLNTYINEIDVSDFLMGRRGFFATDEYFRFNVIGVLLHSYFGQYFYFHNEQAAYPLTAINQERLFKWRYA